MFLGFGVRIRPPNAISKAVGLRAIHQRASVVRYAELGELHCKLDHAVQIEPGLRSGLPKTVTFQIFAGDYRRFLPGSGQIWSLETDGQFAKARCWRAFLRSLRTASLTVGLPG
jgi:hypothetical protein